MLWQVVVVVADKLRTLNKSFFNPPAAMARRQPKSFSVWVATAESDLQLGCEVSERHQRTLKDL